MSINLMLDLLPTQAFDWLPFCDQDNALGLLVNGHRYDLDSMDSDPLLDRINEWDYPIFEMKDQAKDLILSQSSKCSQSYYQKSIGNLTVTRVVSMREGSSSNPMQVYTASTR
ncbi:hypothetical protein CEXT_554441 [Caerostris extrusa]|uniref:Uncharacterized protein n=1 Tax=Caerostris extrusa TaxID=172846 RepID=A0AAV4NFL0_CAEEX|nr:hypothetical protein CEXT_554441 [Caerostris extrusa]